MNTTTYPTIRRDIANLEEECRQPIPKYLREQKRAEMARLEKIIRDAEEEART